MIVAYSSIYHRPSSSSPIVSGASGSSSSPTNPAIPSARAPRDRRNRRRQSSPMDRPRRARAARARRIPPRDERSRPSPVDVIPPPPGWVAAIARRAGVGRSSVRRRVPSELAEGRASGERSVDFAPDERAAPHRQSMRCDAVQCVFDLRVPTAPGSIASIGHPREATGSDRISRRELADRDPPRATPPKRERTRRGGGGEIRDRQATRTPAKRRRRRRLGRRTKERPACRSQSMPPIIVASHYRRSTIAQIRNNIGGGHLPSPPPWRRRRPNPRRGTPPTAKNEHASHSRRPAAILGERRWEMGDGWMTLKGSNVPSPPWKPRAAPPGRTTDAPSCSIA